MMTALEIRRRPEGQLENLLGREEWVRRATKLLSVPSSMGAREYAESLYETYVEDDWDGWSPEDAVSCDTTYSD